MCRWITGSVSYTHLVQNLYPEAKVAIGPSIDTGFYYDFDHEPFSREDLDAIEKEMKKIIKKGAKIERFTKSREDAIAYFKEKNEPYKVELIEDLPEGEEISFYSQGDWTCLLYTSCEKRNAEGLHHREALCILKGRI